MKDPRSKPLPTPKDQVEEIHIYAADLAYGYKIGEFADKYLVMWVDHSEPDSWVPQGGDEDVFYHYLDKKWGNRPPPAHLLESYDYLRTENGNLYMITAKALELLNDPRFHD